MNPSKLLYVLLFLVCASATRNASADDIDFAHEVVPILRQHCAECHGDREAKGGFSINSRESFLEGDQATPHDADASYFLELIGSDDPDVQMPPPKKPRVSPRERETLVRWVNQGMQWQDDFSFAAPTYDAPLKPRQVKLPPAIDQRNHPIDRVIDSDLASRGIAPLEPVDDSTFMRRVSLDLNGLLPSVNMLNAFVDDSSSDKDQQLVDQLLANDLAYTEHWLTFWNDLFRNDYDGTGFITGGRKQITSWLYKSLVDNKPYDVMTRELLAPQNAGSRGFIDGIKWRGDVSAGQTVEIQFSQSVAQSFLGINMKCASCHDSFIDQWKLSDAYALAAIYSESPLELHRCDKPTGEMASAAWLFPELGNIDASLGRDERLSQLARLMTHRENGRYARTIVNRLWCQLMGRGIVHPLDAMHTRPWNEDLLDVLANHLIESGFDLKATLRFIATSNAYRSRCEFESEQTSTADYVYAGPRAKRLTAEQFVDAVWQLTNSAPAAFDAPVIRHADSMDGDKEGGDDFAGQWIWGDSASAKTPPPSGETLVFRRTIDLPSALVRGVAVITADNAFKLYLGGREIVTSNDWTKPVIVPLQGRFKQGKNDITIVATNAGNGPNPAGLFFDSWMEFESGEMRMYRTDETWRYTANPVGNSKEGRLGKVIGPFKPVVIVRGAGYASAFTPTIRQRFQSSRSQDIPMVRASLRKADFLMRALGRPNRDQIVTSRPRELTMLEAIELYNGHSFAELLSRGAEYWMNRKFESIDEMIDAVFRESVSRPATAQEIATSRELVGQSPSRTSVEDLLWSVLMMPEFFVVQ